MKCDRLDVESNLRSARDYAPSIEVKTRELLQALIVIVYVKHRQRVTIGSRGHNDVGQRKARELPRLSKLTVGFVRNRPNGLVWLETARYGSEPRPPAPNCRMSPRVQ
jgi:hypothetical protein